MTKKLAENDCLMFDMTLRDHFASTMIQPMYEVLLRRVEQGIEIDETALLKMVESSYSLADLMLSMRAK